MLRVSDNRRFLVHDDGSPFFYLGDTAWCIFHRLDREEADLYLENRAAKGFTVIQAVVLAEHVDYIVAKAASLGLHIGMLPTWGDKVGVNYWGSSSVNGTAANRSSGSCAVTGRGTVTRRAGGEWRPASRGRRGRPTW